jgi:hypothetical protein
MPERLLTVEKAGDYVAAQTVEAMQLPGCADPPTRPATVVWQRTQASFGTVAGPLSRSGRADPIGTEDVRQQAVSGAMAHVDGGSDPASGVPSAEQSKIMFGGYSTQWVADRRLGPRSRELYAMLLRLHIMPWVRRTRAESN